MATWVLKYYLDDIKTICQNYTQKYDNIEFVDICRRTRYIDLWNEHQLQDLTRNWYVKHV